MSDYVVTALRFCGRDYYAAALFEDRVAEELVLEEKGCASLVGSIYCGAVDSVSSNIGGVFVDIGLPAPAFLPLARHSHLSPSQKVLVQVVKEASGRKEPVLTRDISLSGRYAVVYSSPGENAFSRKLTDVQKDICRKWLAGEAHPFRILVRTNAARCAKAEFLEEVRRLELAMEDILKRYERARKGEKLWMEEPFYVPLFRDLCKRVDRCITDIPAFAEGLERLAGPAAQAEAGPPASEQAEAPLPAEQHLSDLEGTDTPHSAEHNLLDAAGADTPLPVEYRPGGGEALSLPELYGLPQLLEKLLRREVYLKSGAYLVIERTEAFVVIDVNTGKCRRGRIPEETYRSVNLEAAQEIARQLRLRNLSGTILVDFINLTSPDHRTELIQVMKKLLKRDRVHTEAVDLTALGIMEILRQKARKPLAETLHLC